MMYLLDTNICIYVIKKKPPEVLRILEKKAQKDVFISAITVAELEHGVDKSLYPVKNKMALIEFLSIFTILNFDAQDAVAFGTIKRELEKGGKIIGPFDLLLAAQAKAKKIILVTNNNKDFERLEGLKIENWAEGGMYGKA